MQHFDLTSVTKDQDVIVFDGECVLCAGFFQFMLRHDRLARFKFVTAQSSLGQQMYISLGLPTEDFETNLVIVDGQVFQRLDAFAAAMRALPGLWPVLGLCRFLPRIMKDPVYFAVARNRYRLFGQRPSCLIPDAAIHTRFLPGGF